MAFFPAFPYTPRKATPHSAEVCFRFLQTTVFPLPFSPLHNLSQTFINTYDLYFALLHNVYIGQKNVKLVPLFSSAFYYLLRFLENQS